MEIRSENTEKSVVIGVGEKLEENNQEQGFIRRKLKEEAVKLFGISKLTSSMKHYRKVER